jgi:hypothetical protein
VSTITYGETDGVAGTGSSEVVHVAPPSDDSDTVGRAAFDGPNPVERKIWWPAVAACATWSTCRSVVIADHELPPSVLRETTTTPPGDVENSMNASSTATVRIARYVSESIADPTDTPSGIGTLDDVVDATTDVVDAFTDVVGGIADVVDPIAAVVLAAGVASVASPPATPSGVEPELQATTSANTASSPTLQPAVLRRIEASSRRHERATHSMSASGFAQEGRRTLCAVRRIVVSPG